MRSLTTITLALVAIVALTACSTDDATRPSSTEESTSAAPTVTPDPAESSSATPTPEPSATEPSGTVLTVTIKGDDVAPNGEVLTLGTGETLTIRVTSDRAGELHVHAKPEQFVEFTKGTSTTEIVIKTPGVVEVEDHETDAVVAQIEVR